MYNAPCIWISFNKILTTKIIAFYQLRESRVPLIICIGLTGRFEEVKVVVKNSILDSISSSEKMEASPPILEEVIKKKRQLKMKCI